MGQTISRYCSSIAHESQSINGAANGLIRAELQVFDLEGQPLFPSPVFTSYQIAIPIYLLIPTYFATLLLIWLVLITRLTRRMFLTQADGLKKFDALAWRMQSAATDAVSGKSPLRLLEYPPTCSP